MGKREKSKKAKREKVDKNLKKEEKRIKKVQKKDKKKKKKKNIWLRILKWIIILILVMILLGIAAFVAIMKTDKWAITKEELLAEAGAKIYDKNGDEIISLTGDEINRKLPLDEMGKIPDAFVSIEDERYYQHKGVDYKRTAHAILKFGLSGGKTKFGGSTITQQLVKITMKDDSRKGIQGVERKIREWSRARQVEDMLSKDQILQRYLNRIYLGSSNGLEVRGVGSASNYYFNKEAKDLTVAEAAFIAGINHAPAKYNVFNDDSEETKNRVKKRTKTVLQKMRELNKIPDEQQYNDAIKEVDEGLKFKRGENLSNGKTDINFHTAAALNQIANELSEKKDISYNEAREQLITSGYKIYTTMDKDIQEKMQNEFRSKKYVKYGLGAKGDVARGQAAMVIIEPSTGYVVGEVGELSDNPNTLGINRGLSSRQPGSAFKPVVTIAPGLEYKVITPATLFWDVKTDFGGYSPNNDSNRYRDVISIREALKYSSNIPEVKLLQLIGLQKSAKFLSSIGMKVNPDKTGLSLALGAYEVTPVQLAAGYAMIANKGEYIEPTFYTKVEDAKGNVVIEKEQERHRAMSEANAYLEETMLRGPIQGGTASRYNKYLGSMDVGGKTGTSDRGVDRWFCGITPYYAAACWYGADNGRNFDGKGHNISFYGSYGNPAANLWFPIMKAVHNNLKPKQFEKPDSVINCTICKVTGRKAADSCTDTYTELVAKDNVPAVCDGHVPVKVCKESKKLATEFCPDVETRLFAHVLDTEKKGNWKPKMSGNSAPTDYCNIHTKAAEIEVPNVVGKKQSEAEKLLKDKGFVVKVVKDSDINKTKGAVLSQSDKGKKSKGATITIVVNQAGKEEPKKDKPGKEEGKKPNGGKEEGKKPDGGKKPEEKPADKPGKEEGKKPEGGSKPAEGKKNT